jgi:hypothetical protein
MHLRAVVLCCSALACAALVWAFGYDLDEDGQPDSISVGGSDIHMFVTGGDEAEPSSGPFDGGRLYHVPPAYVHLIIKKAFDWDSRWDVLRWDADSRMAEALRLTDKAHVSVRVDDWRGWSLVRVSVRDTGAGSKREVANAVFQCLETILFHGIASPRTVRGFAPH